MALKHQFRFTYANNLKKNYTWAIWTGSKDGLIITKKKKRRRRKR